MRGQIHQAGHIRGQPRPNIDVAECIRTPRAQAAFVVMRQELSLVGGYIDAHGTVTFATFAGQTEVERFLHVLIAPAVVDDIALGHLPQQMSPAAGGMFLLAGYAETGTHCPAFEAPAFAHSHAAQSGVGEAAVILGKTKMGLWFPGMVPSTEAEILVQPIRLDDLARIHFPVWVPRGFELAEGMQQFRSKHPRQKFGT